MKILHKESSYYAFYQKSSKEKKNLKSTNITEKTLNAQ